MRQTAKPWWKVKVERERGCALHALQLVADYWQKVTDAPAACAYRGGGPEVVGANGIRHAACGGAVVAGG